MYNSHERPLLTFALVACNQEQFIREAVDAALAQTYSPLEIIISDDCSTDSTFDIIREMANAYRGPHSLVLNRNPLRRGIGGHFNVIGHLARGELVVVAAADDVSFPHRTEVIYTAWVRAGRRATSVHSDFVQIDQNGRAIERVFPNEYDLQQGDTLEQQPDPEAFVRALQPSVFGCTHAFSPSLFRTFGDMPDEITHEDDVLAFRSVLTGGLLYINTPLVKYRLHGANMYLSADRKSASLSELRQQEIRIPRYYRNRETMYEAFLRDLNLAANRQIGTPAVIAAATREAESRRDRLALIRRYFASGLLGKLRLLRALRRADADKHDLALLRKRLIPSFFLLRLRYLAGRAALMRKRNGRSA